VFDKQGCKGSAERVPANPPIYFGLLRCRPQVPLDERPWVVGFFSLRPRAGKDPIGAQAFKRASSCFGLGRYLYYFTGVWVDLDERKRPKNVPHLFDWATPAGWRAGLRPKEALQGASSGSHERPAVANSQIEGIIREIENLAEPLGRGLYRGVLRDVAKVWNPRDIQDGLVQQKVLDHMRAAERGLRRLEAALDKAGPEKLIPVLKSLGLSSLERVDTLEILKRIVLEMERLAQEP